MYSGYVGGIGEEIIESRATACSTQRHVTSPTQRKGGSFRRFSDGVLSTSRRFHQNCSPTSPAKLTNASSSLPSAPLPPVAQSGIVGRSHAGPSRVNGHEHSPESSLQLPKRSQPAGHDFFRCPPPTPRPKGCRQGLGWLRRPLAAPPPCSPCPV